MLYGFAPCQAVPLYAGLRQPVLCCTMLLCFVCCRGGHGRTGTLVAVMLGRLYGLNSSAALRLTQVCVVT
jgi:hypothetical protein